MADTSGLISERATIADSLVEDFLRELRQPGIYQRLFIPPHLLNVGWPITEEIGPAVMNVHGLDRLTILDAAPLRPAIINLPQPEPPSPEMVTAMTNHGFL